MSRKSPLQCIVEGKDYIPPRGCKPISRCVGGFLSDLPDGGELRLDIERSHHNGYVALRGVEVNGEPVSDDQWPSYFDKAAGWIYPRGSVGFFDVLAMIKDNYERGGRI